MSDKPRTLSPLWNQCARKKRYTTMEKANEIAERRSKAVDHEIHAYPCRFCGGFHIGRSQPC